MNVLNGGAHADTNVDVQEFMLAPVGRGELLRSAALGRRDVPRAEGAAAGARPQHRARRRRRLRARPAVERGGAEAAGRSDRARPGYRPGEEIALALDVASTEFFADGVYTLAGEGRKFTSPEFAVVPRRPLRPLPDRLDRRRHGRRRLGRLARAHRAARRRSVQLVGDDLFVTNTERLARRHRRAASPTRSS